MNSTEVDICSAITSSVPAPCATSQRAKRFERCCSSS
ncbi:Uncharacterised protein [Mycobacteroides abscessus subsp. abscessus]|nr:Uncharacterised protein [Mycobacteroides abscessus subsp. abscessus]SHX78307.1 Uncharacterised protein [Mycobacteroides abscessus subsp. abscessus]SKU08838.1 Uncharacterised protein [Mycobacteroides abscessus subsp. abscessus]